MSNQRSKKEMLYHIIINDWIGNEVARIHGTMKLDFMFLSDEEKKNKTFAEYYNDLKGQGQNLEVGEFEKVYSEEGNKSWYVKDDLKEPEIEKLSDLINEETQYILEQAKKTHSDMTELMSRLLNQEILIQDGLTQIDEYATKERAFYRAELDKVTGENEETRAEKDKEASDTGQRTPKEAEMDREAEIQAALKRMGLDRS